GVLHRFAPDGDAAEMTSVAFSPGGEILATARNDGPARLRATKAGQQLLTVTHGSHVVSGAFSPDGKLLATGSADGKLRLFTIHPAPGGASDKDSKGVHTTLQLRMELAHGEEVRQVAFSPNGQQLAAIS